jgi:hypothetical protein
VTILRGTDVEFGAMLVDRTPQQERFAPQRDEHLVKMPCATRLASRRFHPVSKDLAEFVAPASDGLVVTTTPRSKSSPSMSRKLD